MRRKCMIGGRSERSVGRRNAALGHAEGRDVQVVDDGRHSGSLLDLRQNALALLCALHCADDGDGSIIDHEMNGEISIRRNSERHSDPLANGGQEDSIAWGDRLVLVDDVAVDVGITIDESIGHGINARGHSGVIACASETIGAKAVRRAGKIIIAVGRSNRAVSPDGPLIGRECSRLQQSRFIWGSGSCTRTNRGTGTPSTGGAAAGGGLSKYSRSA